jgi:glycosyltransferase involved in cell wall biosynthesis
LMRILVLCKRQYTGKDLLIERYGRLWELPQALATAGHEVFGIAIDYRRAQTIRREGWQSVRAWPLPQRLLAAWRTTAERFAPEVIWASSDAAHLVAGQRLGDALGVPVVVDHYDDYETFALTRWCGLRSALRVASQRANAITVVGQRLAETLRARCGDVEIHVIPNGVPAGFGSSVDRRAARTALKLPVDAKLIGTAGALQANRGIADLVAAAHQLFGTARLVIAGPGSRPGLGAMPAGTIDLGVLPHAQIPLLLRALDVGVICNRDSDFGRHCFPMKLVEMAACGLPVVAADVGEVSALLRAHPQSRYTPGDSAQLAERLRHALHHPDSLPTTLAATWHEIARGLEVALQSATRTALR